MISQSRLAKYFFYPIFTAVLNRTAVGFLNGKSPLSLNNTDVKNFLSHLAVDRKVSASTQKQAFNAILFVFRHALDQEIENIQDTVRAKPRRKLPVVLTRYEIMKIFDHLHGVMLLMAKLIYGGGLRLQECLRLRVNDFDLEQGMLTIRSGKGDKDRVTIIPESLKEEIVEHLVDVKKKFKTDKENGANGVWLPNALERKYPNAGKEWGWQ